MYLYHSITADRVDIYSRSHTYKVYKNQVCSAWENTRGVTNGNGKGYSFSRGSAAGGYCPPGPQDPYNPCPQDGSYEAGSTFNSGYFYLGASVGTRGTTIGTYKNLTSWSYRQWGYATVKCPKNIYLPCSYTCGQPKASAVEQTNSGTSKFTLMDALASEPYLYTAGIYSRSTTREHRLVGHPTSESPLLFKSTRATDFTSKLTTLLYGVLPGTTRTATTYLGTYKWQAQRYDHPIAGHRSVPIFTLTTDALMFAPYAKTTAQAYKGWETYAKDATVAIGRLGPPGQAGAYRRIPGAWVGGANKQIPLFSKTTNNLNGWVGLTHTSPKFTYVQDRVRAANSSWNCQGKDAGETYFRSYRDISLTMKGPTITDKFYIGKNDCGAAGPARTEEWVTYTNIWGHPQASQEFAECLDSECKKYPGRTAYFDSNSAGVIAVITGGKLAGATAVSAKNADYLKPMIVPTNGAGEAEVLFHDYGKPYKATWWSQTGPKETDYTQATSWMYSSCGPTTLITKDGTKITSTAGTFARYWTFAQVGKQKTPVTTHAELSAVSGKYGKENVEATALVYGGDYYTPYGPGMHPNEGGGFYLNDGAAGTIMLPPLASSAVASFAISAPTNQTGSIKTDWDWSGRKAYWNWQLLGTRKPTQAELKDGDDQNQKTWVAPDLGNGFKTFTLGTNDIYSIVRSLPQTYTDGTGQNIWNNTNSEFARLANLRDQPGFQQQIINGWPQPQSYTYRNSVGKTMPAAPPWSRYQLLVRGVREPQYVGKNSQQFL